MPHPIKVHTFHALCKLMLESNLIFDHENKTFLSTNVLCNATSDDYAQFVANLTCKCRTRLEGMYYSTSNLQQRHQQMYRHKHANQEIISMSIAGRLDG